MKIDISRELNPEQLDAVRTVNGPLLIIAGAGSGKTRVITYRIAHMLEQGIPQASILALTFTNKAAREMRDRVREIQGSKLRNLTVSTFHAFGVRVLKSHIARLGYRENFSIYDQSDQYGVIKEAAREIKHHLEPGDVSKVQDVFSRVKTGRAAFTEETDELRALYQEYLEHLKLYNAVDFDDLIVLPLTLFAEHPDVLEEYRGRFTHIMVDEFQDTSTNQYRMMKVLAETNRNVCVVGDDDQSIYSWRGADFSNILNFEIDFPERKEVKLEQNYRSTGTILAAANRVIANNRNRKLKELWSGVGGGHPIDLYFPEDEMEEGELIARMIKNLSMTEGVKYRDVGVLVRTNSLTRNIEVAFLRDNVPYQVSGGMSFFQRKEIKDLIAYLKLIANPDDDVSLLRVLNTPRRGIGKRSLQIITDTAQSRGESLFSAITALAHATDSPLGTKAAADVAEFASLVGRFREVLIGEGNRGKNRLSEGLARVIEEIDYWGYLVVEHQSNDKLAKWKFRNMQIFTEFLKNYEEDPDVDSPNLFDFLRGITLESRDSLEEDEKAVSLMTIHAAKGLEHDVVFLAGVEDGIIPHARAIEESPANVEEERRLFYVAITRARRKLFMTSCRKRRIMRETVECSPSPFLEEIPDELVAVKETETPVTEEEAVDYFASLKAKFASGD
jgi:DNA helicase-2/ATP-dependent DNA helicase PcrA